MPQQPKPCRVQLRILGQCCGFHIYFFSSALWELLFATSEMFAFITEPLFWVLGYVYMPYMSFKAIQTPDGKDDKEWLTTWVIYSMLSMLQTIPIISSIVVWIPLYYEFKLVVIVYCVFFKGAGVIYRKLIYRYK